MCRVAVELCTTARRDLRQHPNCASVQCVSAMEQRHQRARAGASGARTLLAISPHWSDSGRC
jgi:hypothetical protein